MFRLRRASAEAPPAAQSFRLPRAVAAPVVQGRGLFRAADWRRFLLLLRSLALKRRLWSFLGKVLQHLKWEGRDVDAHLRTLRYRWATRGRELQDVAARRRSA